MTHYLEKGEGEVKLYDIKNKRYISTNIPLDWFKRMDVISGVRFVIYEDDSIKIYKINEKPVKINGKAKIELIHTYDKDHNTLQTTELEVNPSGNAFIMIALFKGDREKLILKDFKNNRTLHYGIEYYRMRSQEVGFLNDNVHYIKGNIELPTVIDFNSRFGADSELFLCSGTIFYALKDGYFISTKEEEGPVSLYRVDEKGKVKTIKKLFMVREISRAQAIDIEEEDEDDYEEEDIANAYLFEDTLICEIHTMSKYLWYSWDITDKSDKQLIWKSGKFGNFAKYFYSRSNLACLQSHLLKVLNKNLATIVRRFVFPGNPVEKCDSTPWFKLLEDDKEGKIKILWT